MKFVFTAAFYTFSIASALLMVIVWLFNSPSYLPVIIVYSVTVLLDGLIVAAINAGEYLRLKQKDKQSFKVLLADAPTVDIFTELSKEECLKADLNADIAQTLYDFRRDHGLTVKEFADMLGISEEAVISMEYLEQNFDFTED